MTTATARLATSADIPALRDLIQRSARGLCSSDYTDSQIEAALKGAWALDLDLVEDGTYYVLEQGGAIVACGGWGKRATAFGGGEHTQHDARPLDPKTEAARIRAFFVAPECARKGLGRALLELCSNAARAAGFRSLELAATLPGTRLYGRHGFVEVVRACYRLEDDVEILFVTMRKELSDG